MPGQYIIGQGHIKAGFKISADPPVRNRQKCFPVEKMVIHAHVFDIVQPYQSDLVHLSEDLRLLLF